MRLKGKVSIITGAADPEGIGAAIAVRYAKEGAKVVIADILDGGEVVKILEKEGGEAIFMKTDVTKQEACDAMAKAAVDRFGSIDILVNNAAFYGDLVIKPFTEITTEEWNRVMEVNTTGPFHCLKAVFPYMKEKGGKIINTASSIFLVSDIGSASYVASKGAVFAFTRTMAAELGDYNINVNSLAPGYTQTPASKRTEQNARIPIGDYDDTFASNRCLKRTEYAEDLAGTAFFLASSDSDFITGQMIVVDGGAAFN
jgi:NAD(P)-dependent dehydrogenase (short-subunit alcohol dehydrogenase family)